MKKQKVAQEPVATRNKSHNEYTAKNICATSLLNNTCQAIDRGKEANRIAGFVIINASGLPTNKNLGYTPLGLTLKFVFLKPKP